MVNGIIPLHKKGDVNCVENYRGITLLSNFGKLFTRILNNRLPFLGRCLWCVYWSSIWFRANYSTVDHIFNLHGVMSHLLNNSKKLYCGFLDFRKAYDYIDENFLWHKLIGLGIRGRIFDVIQSIYSVVKSQVQVGAEKTDEFECLLGVRQGECLSPFFWRCIWMTSKILSKLTNLKVLIWALRGCLYFHMQMMQ